MLECYHLENQYASFFYRMHKMMVKIEVITMLLPVENTTDALNTQSQELYKSSQSEKGFTPTINTKLSCTAAS